MNLKTSYYLYQDVLSAINSCNTNMLKDIINNNHTHTHISNYMKTSVKSIKKNIKFIENTITSNYSLMGSLKVLITLSKLLNVLLLDIGVFIISEIEF